MKSKTETKNIILKPLQIENKPSKKLLTGSQVIKIMEISCIHIIFQIDFFNLVQFLSN